MNEARLAVLEEKVRAMGEDIHAMGKKVDEMHSLLLQAKGARWAIIAMASVGGFVAGFMAKIISFASWFAPLPK